MSDRDIERLLRDVEVPDSSAARSRTTELGRSAAAARVVEAPSRSRRLMRGLGLGLIGAALILSPPGRAAAGFVAGLAGIGESPSLEHPEAKRGTAVVLGTGADPDGTGYEVVQVHTDAPRLARGLDPGRRSRFEQALERSIGDETGLCFKIDWPSSRTSSGNACSFADQHGGGISDPVYGTIEPMGLHARREAGPGAEPIAWGLVGSEVNAVRVLLTERGGDPVEIPVDFLRVTGELRERIGSEEDFGVYVSFPNVPHDLPVLVEEDVRIETIAYDSDGDEIERHLFPDAEIVEVFERLRKRRDLLRGNDVRPVAPPPRR